MLFLRGGKIMKKSSIIITAILGALSLSGCGIIDNPDVTPTSFSFDQPSIVLEVGDSMQFSYTILPDEAKSHTISYYLDAGGEDIVSINTFTQTITALSIGETTLKAMVSGTNLGDTIKISVVDEILPIQRIDGIASSYDVHLFDTLQLDAKVVPTNATNPNLSYVSKDTSVATVDKFGMVTALTRGETDITISAVDGSNVSVVTHINVIPVANPITSIKLTPAESTVFVGDVINFKAEISPKNATYKQLEWLVSNSNYASIDENGNLIAKAIGDVTVTAKSLDGSNVMTSAEVHIVDPTSIKVSSIELSPDVLTMNVGGKASANVKIMPANAYNKSLSWSIGDTSIARVDENGEVTGLKIGVTTLTALADDGSGVKDTIEVNVTDATKQDLSLDVTYRDAYFAPSQGDQKLLMVPIKLADTRNVGEWDDEKLSEIDSFIYDMSPETGFSLASYYFNASYGKLRISGDVAPVYETRFTRTQLDSNWDNIITMFNEATTWLGQNGINLDDYDRNDDGYIDSIHFIVNATNVSGNSNMWPHMAQTGNEPGTITNPLTNTYSLSNLDHFGDAVTTIHEQGHIFGLEDYYDYSYSGVDYIGEADMQSYNVMDWNAFSKLNVGWIDPYIYDTDQSSMTFTISPQSTSGDAIIVPTSSFNNSIYDEYLLIELFAPVGNNAYFWNDWTYDLGEGGIRMYHVDARLGYLEYNGWYNSNVIVIDDPNNQPEYAGYAEYLNTNSRDDSDYAQTLYSYAPTQMAEYEPYHLLHLLQAGGADTFSSTIARSTLNESDLFKTGDEFTLSSFTAFFANSTTFNNGESFPYRISFDEVTSTHAKITVSHIS